MEPTATTPWTAVGAEIAEVLANVDPNSVAEATSFLDERPGRWFFTGQGRSGLVARMAAMRFMHLGRNTHVVGEATAPSVSPGDHLIALSSSGSTAVTLHLARLAVHNEADLLAVTTRADSELAGLATAVLVVPAPASSQFGGSLFEQTALILLDSIVLHLTAHDPDSYRSMAARHANLE